MDKKIIAEEELKKILLYMKYDNKNTLSENKNKIFIFEQECANKIDFDTINNVAKTCGETFKKMDAPFIRMGYGLERAKLIYTEISKLVNKNFYDDATQECVPSMTKFNELFIVSSSGWVLKGDDFEKSINNLINDYYDNEPQIQSYLKGALKIYKGQIDPTKNNNSKPAEQQTTTPTTTTPNSTQQLYSVPSELKTIEDGVIKFQTWMETNHKGWYPGKKPIDGKFGYYTNQAWSNTEYKNEFLKSLNTTSQPQVSNPYAGGSSEDDIES